MDQQQLAAWALDRAIETAKISPHVNWTAAMVQDTARSYVDFVWTFTAPEPETTVDGGDTSTSAEDAEYAAAHLKAVQ